jgi:prephenate dehydratase
MLKRKKNKMTSINSDRGCEKIDYYFYINLKDCPKKEKAN